MSEPFDLIGIGIGPFNLSLAALLEKVPNVRARFLIGSRSLIGIRS